MGHRRRGVGRPYGYADGYFWPQIVADWTQMVSRGTSSPRVAVRGERCKGEEAGGSGLAATISPRAADLARSPLTPAPPRRTIAASGPWKGVFNACVSSLSTAEP